MSMKEILCILFVFCGLAFGQNEIYGIIVTDKRDKQEYHAIKIGNYVWMTRNLNYRKGHSWCYDNRQENCERYGRLYDWNTAKGICPDGWRLPSVKEWQDLIKETGGLGRRLRSPAWNGSDDFEFRALPGGYRFGSGFMGVGYINVGLEGRWWTSTEDSEGNASYIHMGNYDDVLVHHQVKAQLGHAVRCIRDPNI